MRPVIIGREAGGVAEVGGQFLQFGVLGESRGQRQRFALLHRLADDQVREVVGADGHAAAFLQHGVVKRQPRLAEDVHVVKNDVVRVPDLHRVGLGIGGARHAIHVGVGEQEVLAVLDIQRVGVLVSRLLLGLQAVNLPVLRIAEHHFDAAMVLVGELIDLAGRGRVLDAQAGGEAAAFHPDIADDAAAAVVDQQVGRRLAACAGVRGRREDPGRRPRSLHRPCPGCRVPHDLSQNRLRNRRRRRRCHP